MTFLIIITVLLAADSLAFCLAVGLFIAVKLGALPIKKKAEAQKEALTEEERLKIERERRELLNMLNYDGGKQDELF